MLSSQQSRFDATLRRRPNHQSAAAEAVFSDDDLLIEILSRLPIRPLIRSKSICKRWFSLITNDPNLRRRRRRRQRPQSGLFLESRFAHADIRYEFLYLSGGENPTLSSSFKTVSFVPDPFGMFIVQSCHGVLLCGSNGPKCPFPNYYIYNPTTGLFTTVQVPAKSRVIKGLSLAFDSSENSPIFKLICVYSPDRYSYDHQIEIYSSETGTWRASGEIFAAYDEFQFSNPVYWNGTIHWISKSFDPMYFDIDDEFLGSLPMPPTPAEGDWMERGVCYVGESNGHLHLVEIYGSDADPFNVYELERDYSGWFVKYRVNWRTAFAGMYRNFTLLSIVREETEEESFMVIHVRQKLIRYNFVDAKTAVLYDYDGHMCKHGAHAPLRSDGPIRAFPFIESFSSS